MSAEEDSFNGCVFSEVREGAITRIIEENYETGELTQMCLTADGALHQEGGKAAFSWKCPNGEHLKAHHQRGVPHRKPGQPARERVFEDGSREREYLVEGRPYRPGQKADLVVRDPQGRVVRERYTIGQTGPSPAS